MKNLLRVAMYKSYVVMLTRINPSPQDHLDVIEFIENKIKDLEQKYKDSLLKQQGV